MVILISIDNPEMIAWRIKSKERGMNSSLILFSLKIQISSISFMILNIQ